MLDNKRMYLFVPFQFSFLFLELQDLRHGMKLHYLDRVVEMETVGEISGVWSLS